MLTTEISSRDKYKVITLAAIDAANNNANDASDDDARSRDDNASWG